MKPRIEHRKASDMEAMEQLKRKKKRNEKIVRDNMKKASKTNKKKQSGGY